MLDFKTEFLLSLLHKDGFFIKTDDVVCWVKKQNLEVNVNVNFTRFSKLKLWSYNNGSLIHQSGKFFSIDGIRVTKKTNEIITWEQPIINQPEIGYLGIVSKKISGVLHFLLQAKIEPGNLNSVQLSPTLQATKSNYTKAHNGNAPFYLDLFINAKPNQILVDQLQSEQGARFLKKRNRNIIIFTEEDLELHDNFIWLTIAQIKELMLVDNLINMDTRTVISSISFDEVNFRNLLKEGKIEFDFFSRNTLGCKFLLSGINTGNEINSIDRIISFLTNFKSIYELQVQKIDLKNLSDWIFTDNTLSHHHNKFFEVLPVDIAIDNREVFSWSQPIVRPMQEGLCVFVTKEINGVLHFIVQAKIECGNYDVIEFSPTVQCLTGNYKDSPVGEIPFLDYVLNAPKDKIIFDTLQSEEGGRFYREQNRNMILFDNDIEHNLPKHYIWMTLHQIFYFIKFNNFFNIQARSLISAIQYI
jgi:oxidase EvaA